MLKQAVRNRALRKCGGEWCERCGLKAPIAATHHLTYERVGHEHLDDLQGTCSPCHEWLSGVSDLDPVATTLRYFAETAEAAGLDGSGDRLLLEAWEACSPRPVSFLAWDTTALLEAWVAMPSPVGGEAR